MAADQQTIAVAALEVVLDVIGHDLEVLQRFVGLLALGVAGIVSAIAIALAAARKFVDEVLFFADVFIDQLEDASLGAIGQQDARALVRRPGRQPAASDESGD